MVSSAPQIRVKRPKRRSKRLGLFVSVLVHGKDVGGTPFRELTRTLSLSANGALLALTASVLEGQTILVKNQSTQQEQECRVVYVGPAQEGKWSVGVAFIHPTEDFWQVHFPPSVSI